MKRLITQNKEKLTDKLFFIALLISFLLHNGIIIYLYKVNIPKNRSVREIQKYIPKRFVKIIAPKLAEKKEAEGKKGAVKVKMTKEEAKEEGKPGPEKTKEEGTSGENKSIDEAQKREMIKKKVRTKGLLGIITSRGRSSGSPLADILSSSSSTIGDLDSVVRQVTGVMKARTAKDIGIKRAGGTGGGGVDIAKLKATEGGEVGLGGKKNVKVATTIKTERAKIKGVLDSESIRETVMRKMRLIKYCYEKELKKNPELHGKIVVNFTINKNGRVSKLKIESSTMNNEEVGECILRVIKRLTFPPPQKGESVEVSYPFVFTISS